MTQDAVSGSPADGGTRPRRDAGDDAAAPDEVTGPDAERDDSPPAWPHWMARFVGSGGDEGAFWDLIWSVGGSPPYGGVGYDEASAVYELLEAYRGPGMAPDSHYDRVSGFLAGRPDAVLALEAFRI